MDSQQSRTVYNLLAGVYDLRDESPTTRWLRRTEHLMVRRFLPRRKPIFYLALDIGCGAGYHLQFMKSIVGLDISERMLRQAKARGKPLICANAEELPFKDESIDAILCFFAVLNMADFPKVIHEMNRVLKRKGRVLASVASVWERGQRFSEKLASTPQPQERTYVVKGKKMTLHLFTRKEFIDAFRNNGFIPEFFDAAFIYQRPRWGSSRGFTPFEKFKLSLENTKLFRNYGTIYFGCFRKAY